MKLTKKFDNAWGDWKYFLEDPVKKVRWSGDLLWAQRVAAHYNLDMPKG